MSVLIYHDARLNIENLKNKEVTLMNLTRLAVLLATSFADWTNCRLATGLSVLVDASLQALQRPAVCLAITVAAERI